MEKKVLFVIVVLAAIYGGIWLFNHFNPWVGIVAIVIVAYVVIRTISLTIKK